MTGFSPASSAASGDLDRGLEDIEAGELEVLGQETIRTDVSTGAETALVTFSLRVRRDILNPDDALARVADIAHQLVVNAKSGRAAIAELGLTTATDEDRLVAAGWTPDPVGEDVRGIRLEASGDR